MEFRQERLIPRTVHSQNVVDRIVARELYGNSGTDVRRRVVRGPPAAAGAARRATLDTNRAFYTNVFPGFTIVDVKKPPCFLRKFSPDGKRFIAFSQCQTQLEIYFYKGPTSCAEIIHECTGDFLPTQGTPSNPRLQKVRKCAFEAFFALEQVIQLCTIGIEQLNRECSLFSEDGDFVIVGSASYIPDDLHPSMHELKQNNESVTPNPRNPLENYILYCVEVAEGILTDKIEFRVDKIFLSHNQGIYLYKNVLAVLSVQHQTVHLYKFHNGTFVPECKVGRLLYSDDELLLSHVLTPDQQTEFSFQQANFVYRAYRERTINLLKHRILVFLYRRAAAAADARYEVRRFHQYFDQFRALRLWKMQLLDERHLLLKYAHEDVVTLRSHEPNSQVSFFVIYNFVDTRVLAVYENTSEELLELFENFCDFFRNTNLTNLDLEEFRYAQFTSSAGNNIYARLLQQRFQQTIMSAKNGGVAEARRRVLAQLPISAQSYTSSPYLDLSLFSYDEKWVSAMERPKACGEQPVQFYGRESGVAKFRVFAGVHGGRGAAAVVSPSSRRLVAFTFHPTDPFAISVQKTNTEYVVNFHVPKPSG